VAVIIISNQHTVEEQRYNNTTSNDTPLMNATRAVQATGSLHTGACVRRVRAYAAALTLYPVAVDCEADAAFRVLRLKSGKFYVRGHHLLHRAVLLQ